MHIVHLSSVHAPFDTRIFHKECKSLSLAGHDVVLIVPHSESGTYDGVRLRAVPKPKNRVERLVRTTRQTYRCALDEGGDLFHFHDPELIPAGILLRLRGKRVVYDVHERVPKDILTKPWIPRHLRWVVSKLTAATESMAAQLMNGVVVATPAIATQFPDNKTVIVQNFPIVGELTARKDVSYCSRPNNIVYVGEITRIRGIEQMVHGVAGVPGALRARLLLGGNFESPELESQSRNLPGWGCVDYLGYLTRESYRAALEKARIGLVLFHPAPNHLESQPNKLYEYMSAGLPVVVSNFPHWRGLIEEYRCGILVDPFNTRVVTEAMRWLLEHAEEAECMGRRGQDVIYSKFNWRTEFQKMLDFYEQMSK